MAKQDNLKKIPGILKKTYTEKKFKKQILKHIYIQEYKNIIAKLFTRDAQGNYTFNPASIAGYTKPEFKTLKVMVQSIKKNRGLFNIDKIIMLGVIIVLVIAVNFIIKDSLVENMAENWMESIFSARVDFSNFKFKIEQGSIAFAALSVADSEQPFKNLFELGKSEVDLNLAALLKGKVVITNIECQEIKWNTDRKYSGALAQGAPVPAKTEEPQAAAAQKKDAPAPQAAPAFAFDFTALDMNALLKEQQENIQTLKQITETAGTITSLQGKWSGVLTGYQKELETTAGTVQKLTKLRVQDIKTIADAQNTYSQVTGAITNIQTLGTNIASTKEDFLKDLALIKEQQDKITAAITTDYQNLKALIQMPNSEKLALFAGLADSYLKDKIGVLYTYGVKVLGYLAKLKRIPSNEDKEKEKEVKTYEGLNVAYPAIEYPRFLLEQAAFSVGDKAARDYFELNLKNISSDPDLTNAPFSFLFKDINQDQQLLLDGAVDSRQAAALPFVIGFHASRFPFAIDEVPAFLGIKSFKSRFDFETDFSLDVKGAVSGKLLLVLDEIDLSPAAATDMISREIGKILTSIQRIDLDAAYSIATDKQIRMSVNTNLDEIISAQVGKLIRETIKKAEQELKTALDRFLEDKLKDNAVLYAAFQEVRKALDGDLTSVDGYKKLLEIKKQELENYKKQLEDQAKKALEAEAEKLKKQGTDLLNNQVDGLKNKLGF